MQRLTFKYSLEHCPPVEELVKFREGKLPKKMDEDIAHHLTFCKTCSAKVTIIEEKISHELTGRIELPEGFVNRLRGTAADARQERRSAGTHASVGETEIATRLGPDLFTAVITVPTDQPKVLGAGNERYIVECVSSDLGTHISTVRRQGPEGGVIFAIQTIGEASSQVAEWRTDENGRSDMYFNESIVPRGAYDLVIDIRRTKKPSERAESEKVKREK